MTDFARFRQLLRVFSCALLTALVCSSSAAAQTLMWDANTESDLAGYVVQYGTQSGNPTTTIDVGNVTSRTVTGLTAGTTYYFRVVAYNASGQQSTPSTQVSYTVPSTPPPTVPTITGLSPTSGPTAGGTRITITGTNFAAGATVQVGGAAATSVTVSSSTQIVATTPAGSAGARSVQVTSGGVTVASPVGFTYTTATNGPTITSISPNSGPPAGGTVVVIAGTNFAAGATVRFGGVATANVTVSSSTSITAATPAGTSGARDVQITNPDGTSGTLTGGFTYTGTPSTPTITALAPTSGPAAGGTVITITGTNFAAGATVRVGGAAATSVTLSGTTQITATTPAGTAGAQSVQVTSGGTTVTSPTSFTYTTATAPTLTAVSPASGPTAGGTRITLTGTNFVSGATVRVGGAAATSVTFASATQVTATTPAGTAGARDVQITNPNGQSATRTGAFTYASATAPTITSISPSSGPTAGGTVIGITGTNFVAGATVSVGGTASRNVTVSSSTSITIAVPAGTAGARDVTVTNPDGLSGTKVGGFTYTGSTGGLTITSVSPNSGPKRGGTRITITGSGFVGGSGFWVSIGGLMCTNATVVSSTQVQATTPNSTVGTRDVVVRIPSGSSVTLTGGFRYTSNTTTSSQTLTETMTSDPASRSTLAAAGTTQYLAEGVVTDQMSTTLAIANPAADPASVRLNFTTAAGATAERTVDVPARSRATVDLRDVPELAGQSFSTTIDSDVAVAVDRLVSWDGSGLAASLESAVARPSATWYFAEGSTVDPYELYYLVQNPAATAVKIRVRYLLPNGAAPLVRGYSVPAGGRATIWVDREDPALASTDVAAEISSVTGSPIVVERSLYLKDAGSSVPRGGDTSAGVSAPATSWNVEAATGSFATRLLVANPGAAPAQVQATYRTAEGTQVVTSHVVAANSRQTVNVAAESPALANAMVDVKVDASAPVVVERTTSWGAGSTPDETISGGATTAGGARWLLAEAELGGDRQAVTALAVTNRGAATNAKVTLLFEDGPEASATFPVAAGARVAIPVDQAFPMAANRRFSILVEGEDPSASLIVDRTMFWRAAGETRTAGADGAATRLP